MANDTKVTLCKGGTEEVTLPIAQIEIPDLWPIAKTLRKNGRVANGKGCAAFILKCWYIAHDLRRHIMES